MDDKLITEHQEYNNRFFGRWAKVYDLEKYFLFPLREKGAEILAKLVPPASKIIDVATGTGAQARSLAQRGFEVVGVDISPDMLSQAKKKCSPDLKLSFQLVGSNKLPFADSYFDASSISLGLHDMPYDMGISVLKEMSRVTKKSSLLLIVEYCEPRQQLLARLASPFIRFYETRNYPSFASKGLDSYLKDVGLKKLKEEFWLGLFQIVLVSIR